MGGDAVLRKTLSQTELRAPRQQVSTQLTGCPAYSFGKPKHRKGCFKIPVLDSRSPEYVPGITFAPGPGNYDIHETLCRHDTKYGHPQQKKAPAYMWSAKTEPRDILNTQFASRSDPATTMNRYTDLTHCRSDSCLDVPGPGTYDIIHTEGLRHRITGKHQMDMPSYTMRKPCKMFAPGENPRHPPGPAPTEYDTRFKQTITGNRQPAYIIGKAKRVSEALLPAAATDEDMGPGKYEHPIALVSTFNAEERRHRRSIALKY